MSRPTAFRKVRGKIQRNRYRHEIERRRNGPFDPNQFVPALALLELTDSSVTPLCDDERECVVDVSPAGKGSGRSRSRTVATFRYAEPLRASPDLPSVGWFVSPNPSPRRSIGLTFDRTRADTAVASASIGTIPAARKRVNADRASR